jgi:hypothetical protein
LGGLRINGFGQLDLRRRGIGNGVCRGRGYALSRLDFL